MHHFLGKLYGNVCLPNILTRTNVEKPGLLTGGLFTSSSESCCILWKWLRRISRGGVVPLVAKAHSGLMTVEDQNSECTTWLSGR
ncbi:MAG TPA: hypothetical protein DIU35_18935 [Candidatus Latescibacteria bacterium]|nr:hypothetical protein [Candidatus Latescibacterota bacterium]